MAGTERLPAAQSRTPKPSLGGGSGSDYVATVGRRWLNLGVIGLVAYLDPFALPGADAMPG